MLRTYLNILFFPVSPQCRRYYMCPQISINSHMYLSQLLPHPKQYFYGHLFKIDVPNSIQSQTDPGPKYGAAFKELMKFSLYGLIVAKGEITHMTQESVRVQTLDPFVWTVVVRAEGLSLRSAFPGTLCCSSRFISAY